MYSFGINLNSDSVMRSVFYKYLHPKEVFIAESVIVPDLARKKVMNYYVAVLNLFNVIWTHALPL
jgi:hypothetical protein